MAIVHHVADIQSSVGSDSVSAPTNITAGDLLVVVMFLGNQYEPEIAGFTLLLWDDSDPGSGNPALLWKEADGSEGSSFTNVGGPAPSARFMCAMRFSGVKANDPIDSASSNGWSTAFAGSLELDSVSTFSNNAMLLAVGHGSFGPPLTIDQGDTDLQVEDGNYDSAIFTQTLGAAGPTGTRTILSEGGFVIAGFMVALAPIGGDPEPPDPVVYSARPGWLLPI